ncbi:hypothetical protein Ddye_004073 [Dipteronia dyeriana]|uniref:PROP1-like PPR domain-containing protein n=1 Tax=Dipteronia dyeriana TaxID=168575 RepID=A0AAE0CW16_9ROSI|nr:hypothetical protein Ddye_004073 [Dipteronia dyeriana]
MDVNSFFSAKSQALTLITTSTPSLSPLTASTSLRSIRGGGFLRPPAGRTRRKSRKIPHDDILLLHYSRTGSSRFLVKASLNSGPNSVLIVFALTAFAAFVAFSVAYFNHFVKKRNNSKKVSDSSGHELVKVDEKIVNNVVEDRIVGAGNGYSGTSLRENDEYSLVGETNRGFEERNTHQETMLVHDGSRLNETSDSPGGGGVILVSKASDSISQKESESTDLRIMPHVVAESGAGQPPIFATKMSELQFKKDQKGLELNGENSQLTVTMRSTASLVTEIGDHTEVSEQRESRNEFGQEGELTTSYLRETNREKQYSSYGVNPVLKTSSVLSGIKTISSHASPFNSFSLSLPKRNTELKAAEVSAQDSLQTSEYVEGNISPAFDKEGASNKRKDRGRGFPRNKESKHLLQDDKSKNALQFPYPNGIHANYTHQQLSVYNRLLRDGRLTDCVDLLEDMETRGLLDMNKVYHARFFNTCKSRKAIKEAFRFFRLVSNPTLSTFNMLMSVCTSSQDLEGAFQVLRLVQEAGMKADCKLYTTLISTCAKSGKVDAMFKVFHEMVNAGVEPNIHTYGALIDGCAKAGQVAKAFGAYGIMRSKNVKPDRVVFNALITACGQSGAVDRAFDVLSEMRAETQPVEPDHITIGALIKACANAGQVDRAREVYKMINKFSIKGTPEVYTIAVNCSSQTGDWDFACSVYADMKRKGVVPDEVFYSALIDVAGHAGKVESAFEILQEAKTQGLHLGIVSYSSLMGACSNAKNWQKALELYENMKSIKLTPSVSTMNALITALCDGHQLHKAIEVLSEMKRSGLCPNTITYSVLTVASEKQDDIEVGAMLLSLAKEDGVVPNLLMFKCIISLCLRRYGKARSLGEDVLSNSGRPQIENKWTILALTVYREMIVAGHIPTVEVVSQVLGCLQLPFNADLKSRLVENVGVSVDSSRWSKLCSLVDGFGEYDPRAFSLLEEAASLGIVPIVSFKGSPINVDARKLQIHIAEVYLLTVLKGLKHRLAAGSKLPNVTILLSVEKIQIVSAKGEKTIKVAERMSQAITSLLRRLGLTYQGNESLGKIRINGLSLRRWFQPKLATPFSGKPGEPSSFQLGKGITHQQRNIRTGNLSLD